MAQAQVATASVAITPIPFFYIWAPTELEALKKWPPGAVESSRPGRKKLLPSGPSGQWPVTPSELVRGKRLSDLLLPHL